MRTDSKQTESGNKMYGAAQEACMNETSYPSPFDYFGGETQREKDAEKAYAATGGEKEWDAYMNAGFWACAWYEAMSDAAEAYLKTLGDDTEPAKVVPGMLAATASKLTAHNATVPEEDKFPVPEEAGLWQIGEAIMRFYTLAHDCSHYLVYQESGPDKGTYTPVEDAEFRDIICSFIPAAMPDRGKVADEMERWMWRFVTSPTHKRVYRRKSLDTIAVDNGIFNPHTKKLKPFSPRYVFREKCRVEYVQEPDGPVMRSLDDGTVQDMDSWLAGLPDSGEKFMPRLSASSESVRYSCYRWSLC